MNVVKKIDHYLNRLFPITRSITGPGNRETLRILKEIVPLEIKEYPSGTPVYDWIIPDEWSVRDAWIKDTKGTKLVDFKKNNVHLVSYSKPVQKKMIFEDLKKNIHYHEKIPEAIPCRTTYYKRDWGFCVTQDQYKTLSKTNGPLDIMIDTKFDSKGSLSIGELLIQGESKQEILISTYFCHPSLANDNLSGTIMTAFLASELLKKKKLKRTYRIIWVPETIGAIAYCANNETAMKQIYAGMVVSNVGGPGTFGYKQSYNPQHSINIIIEKIFKEEKINFITYPFDIHGSDERQYSSVGFRINMASITKDKYYEYPYYHTSLDNLDFVKAKYISQSLNLYLQVLEKLDQELIYKNLQPHCEPMLSKYDIYPKIGGFQMPNNKIDLLDSLLWILWHCDGNMGAYQLERKMAINKKELNRIMEILIKKHLIKSL